MRHEQLSCRQLCDPWLVIAAKPHHLGAVGCQNWGQNPWILHGDVFRGQLQFPPWMGAVDGLARWIIVTLERHMSARKRVVKRDVDGHGAGVDASPACHAMHMEGGRSSFRDGAATFPRPHSDVPIYPTLYKPFGAAHEQEGSAFQALRVNHTHIAECQPSNCIGTWVLRFQAANKRKRVVGLDPVGGTLVKLAIRRWADVGHRRILRYIHEARVFHWPYTRATQIRIQIISGLLVLGVPTMAGPVAALSNTLSPDVVVSRT